MDTPVIRQASLSDLAPIIGLLADDPLGNQRENASLPLDQCYLDAFDALERDENQMLVVSEYKNEIVGCLQLSFIPGLSRTGMWRAQIESVRVSASLRGRGHGKELIEWAIDEARKHQCRLVQLTTDKKRPDALRFYQGLGFTASHEGMKLSL